jgi:hypothetical protein
LEQGEVVNAAVGAKAPGFWRTSLYVLWLLYDESFELFPLLLAEALDDAVDVADEVLLFVFALEEFPDFFNW